VDSFNFEPLSSPYTEAHHHAVEVVMGGTQADEPREPALPHQGDPTPGMELAMLEGLVTMMENHIADLRTVGDRVTLVYERVDHFMAVLVALDNKLNRLLQMVDDDPSNGEVVGVEITEEVLQQQPVAAEPKPKRRSGKVKLQEPAPEAPGQQTAPRTDDIPS
jgi:hypothetical protein